MSPIEPIVPGFDLPVVRYAANQPEYITLPVVKNKQGEVTSRWRLNWCERLRILLTGDLWVSIMTFNQPLQPFKLDTVCPLFGHYMGDKEV